MSLVRRTLSSNIGQLVLEIVLILVPVFVLTSLLSLLPTAFQQSTGGDLILNTLAAIIIVIVFALEIRKLEHRSLADVGFGRQQWLRQTMLGFTVGGALMTVVIIVLAITGSYHITGADGFAIVECVFLTIALALLTLLFARSPKIGFFHYLLFIVLLVGLISTSVSMLIMIGGVIQEELIFRGLIFRKLERSFGSWIALIVSAIVFGFAHIFNPDSSLVGVLGIAITGGVLSAIIYIMTRSLWWSIGIHLGWNYFEGPFFGAQVSGHAGLPNIFSSTLTGPVAWSGGSFGPEAGLAGIVLASAFGFYLCYRASRQHLMLPRNQPSDIPQDTQPESANSLH